MHFPTLTYLPLGMLLDNFLPNAAPFADINYDLAQLIFKQCKNIHLIAHIERVSEREFRLWRIDDWNSIEEIRKQKKAEAAAKRDVNIELSLNFVSVRETLSAYYHSNIIGHKFTSMLFSAKDKAARAAIAKTLGVDLTNIEHLFESVHVPDSYEVVVNYKGKTIKLW